MVRKRAAVQTRAKTKKASISRRQKISPGKSRVWIFCLLTFWIGLMGGGVVVSSFHSNSTISLLTDTEKKSSDIPLLLGQASEAFNQGNYDKAGALYRRVLQIDPNNYDANLYLANVMGDKMDPPDIGSAIYHSNKALEFKKDYRTLIANGGLYWRVGEYARAEEIFRECTKENPEDYNSWWEMGFMMEKQNKFPGALAAYLKAAAVCSDPSQKSKIEENIDLVKAKTKQGI